jgi:hypothetical protein
LLQCWWWRRVGVVVVVVVVGTMVAKRFEIEEKIKI